MSTLAAEKNQHLDIDNLMSTMSKEDLELINPNVHVRWSGGVQDIFSEPRSIEKTAVFAIDIISTVPPNALLVVSNIQIPAMQIRIFDDYLSIFTNSLQVLRHIHDKEDEKVSKLLHH